MPVWLWSVVLTIACVGAVIWARNHVLLRWHIAELSTAFEHDRVATFLAGHGGRIVFLNPAARALAGQGGKMSIADAFSRVFPNGPSIIGRILADLDQGTYGQDDVQMPQTRFEISAKRLSHGVLWRVHVMQNPKLTTALPMLIVGRDEGILAQNDAMRALIGDGACGLDDVFETRPVVSGAPVGMKTPSGAVTVIPIVQHHNDATQDIYITQPDMAIVPPSSGGIAAALDVLPVALLHIAPEGGVLAANGQAKAMLGLQDDTTHHLSSLLEGLGRPVADWVDDILEGRLPDRSEIMRARLKEDDCFLQVTLSRILEGETASVLAVLQDATELKTMEQKFIQSQKMQAIGELAGGIAHDFNNLLTAIRGHCDLLMMGLAPDAPGYTDLDQPNREPRGGVGQPIIGVFS